MTNRNEITHNHNNNLNSPSASTQTPTVTAKQSRDKKQPDWHEFYKNGVPQEIIVIDDDSPAPSHPGPANPDMHASQLANGAFVEHATKKRRVGAYRDDIVGTTYSGTNTPLYMGSGSDTISSDRNTSAITTAPTSLGSHGGSVGSVGYVETSTAGQKRKRVTRQVAAADKKRKSEVLATDPYNQYVPPPRPAKKAKDITVPVIRDVSKPAGSLYNGD